MERKRDEGRKDKAKRTGRRVPPKTQTVRQQAFDEGVALGVRLEMARTFPEFLEGTASSEQAKSALELQSLIRYALNIDRPEDQPYLESVRAKAEAQKKK